MEYAIVDIETTGANASHACIIEIAIRLYDGSHVVDCFDSLIRPDRNIPPHITALTGIDYDMVCDAPAFEQVAGEIFSLLDGRIFVAHHVQFDYSFLRRHLEEAGYAYAAKTLCTARLARKIKPGLPSYSLGNLCHAWDIPIKNRHRAGGDADATVMLFSKLLASDTAGVIPGILKADTREPQLPPNLTKAQIDALPDKPGVYYFRDREGEVIYVGKAKKLRGRVLQHFMDNSPSRDRKDFLQDIYAVSFERCGTELMALILEAIEIKQLWPKYNRALKKYDPKFGLFSYEDLQGYRRLFVGKNDKSRVPIQVFTTRAGGINKLQELVRRFGLCASLCRLGSCELCGRVNRRADLLCTATDPVDTYNERVNRALSFIQDDRPGFLIVDKGRDKGEKSCIWVENGRFYGMGYISHEEEVQTLVDIKDRMTRYEGSHYIMQLLISYICRYPQKVFKFEQAIEQGGAPGHTLQKEADLSPYHHRSDGLR